MPFTHDQFLDVFARYNTALWPAAVVLWLLSAGAFAWLFRAHGSASRAIAALLALHWAWAGIAYHAVFFTSINPAARVFAAVFLLEAALLAWFGVVRERLRFSFGPTLRHLASVALVAYGLLYPTISAMAGQVYPRAATFGVPCPTTLLTAGFLLALDAPFPRWIVIIPILWALVGGSASFLLHVPADWALFAAAVALVVHAARRPARAPEVARV